MSTPRECLHQLALAADRGAQTVIVGAAYTLGKTKHRPRPEETISSYVGRAQLRGAGWARPVAAAIDWLFVQLGEAPGHCVRNIVPAAADPVPTS